MNALNKIFIDITVMSMLNPLNKDFFIKTLTIEKIKYLLENADDDLIDIFWTALGIAQGVAYCRT